ncbi:MAG: DUF6785 family protein [Thermofilaceae archaeon]
MSTEGVQITSGATVEVRPKGLTLRALLIGLVAGILFILPLYWWPRLSVRRTLRVMVFFGTQYFVFLLTLVITSLLSSLILRKRLSAQENTIVYAIIWSMVPVPFCVGLATFSYLFGILQSDFVLSWDAVPGFWVPKGLKDQLWDGGAPISALFPTVILFTFIQLMLFALSYGIALLYKEQFLEVERLEYPLARVAEWLAIQSTTVKEGGRIPNLWKSIFFWVAFAIGLLINVQGPPGVELVPAIQQSIPSYIGYDVSYVGQLPTPFTNALIAWSIDILGLSYYLLFPLDILLTGIVAFIVFWIIWPIIAVAGGFREPMFGSSEWPVFYTMGMDTPPIMPEVILDHSVWIGIGILTIWMARHHLTRTLKALSRGGKGNVPLSYRTIWVMIIGSTALLFAFMSVSGAHPLLAFYAVFVLAFSLFTQIRIRGDVWPGFMAGNWGPWTGGSDILSNGFYHLAVAVGAAPGFYTPLTGEQALHLYVTRNFVEGPGQKWYAQWNYGIAGIEAMSIAESTKTDLKEVFIAQLIATLVAVPLTFTLLAQVISNVGVKNYVADWWAGQQLVWPATVDGLMKGGFGPYGGDKAPYFYLNVLLGVLLVLAMGFARMRFAWFPLNPVGLMLFSVSFYAFLYGLVAYVIKFLILKIFGSKFYEEKAFPAFLGLFIGAFIGYLPARGIVFAIQGR